MGVGSVRLLRKENDLQKILKKEVKRAKNSFWDKKCKVIDLQLGSSRSRSAWRMLKLLRTNTREMKPLDPIGIEEWVKYYR